MMLEIMVFVIDDIHGFLGLLVLDILVIQDRLYTLQLMAHPKIHPLHMVSIHDRHASKIDQRTDRADLQHIGSAERCILEHKTHIADQKNSQCNSYIRKQLLIRHVQLTLCLRAFAEKQLYQTIDKPIDQDQTQQSVTFSHKSIHIIAVTVNLPLQRCRKLCHNKSPGTHIPDILRRGIAADIDESIHEHHSGNHTEDPQHIFLSFCHLQKDGLQRKCHRTGACKFPPRDPPFHFQNTEHTGHPFCQRRINSGNIRHKHLQL